MKGIYKRFIDKQKRRAETQLCNEMGSYSEVLKQLTAAGDGKGILVLSRDSKTLSELIDAAKVGPLVVDAAVAGTGVVVDAPPIRTHHVQILSLFFGAESL